MKIVIMAGIHSTIQPDGVALRPQRLAAAGVARRGRRWGPPSPRNQAKPINTIARSQRWSQSVFAGKHGTSLVLACAAWRTGSRQVRGREKGLAHVLLYSAYALVAG